MIIRKGGYLLICAFFVLVSCSKKKDKPEDIQGKAKKEIISFSPKITGRILKIYVKEGQMVHKGDTLALIDTPEVNAKIAQAQGAVSAAQAQEELARNGATNNQLLQLRAKYRGLKEQYTFAKKSFSRATNMYKDSLLAPQAYDEAYARLQGAKAQFEAVEAELQEVERGTRLERIEMARGQASQAQGALQEANVAYAERYVIATNDMEIETISLNTGELATAGFALFNGYIPQSTYFRFTIPETQIKNYPKGKSVQLQVVYNQEVLEGNIIYVKQLTRYADITTAYPDYQLQEAIYEIKVQPKDVNKAKNILVNANVVLK